MCITLHGLKLGMIVGGVGEGKGVCVGGRGVADGDAVKGAWGVGDGPEVLDGTGVSVGMGVLDGVALGGKRGVAVISASKGYT